MNTRILAATALVVGATFAGCEPAVAAPADVSAAGQHVGFLLADPHDVACTLEGTLWVCQHTLGADAGNVIVAVRDYAGCPSTEDSCGTTYTVPTSGPHAGDGHLMVVGLGN